MNYLVYVVENRGHDRDYAHFLGEICYSQKALELLQGDNNSSTRHKSNKSCFWKEVDDKSKPTKIQ